MIDDIPNLREDIKKILMEFYDTGIPILYKREIKLAPYLKTNSAIVVTGPRRAGKTYLLFQIMKELKKDITDYLYINFEDNRLSEFTKHNFEDVLDAYHELNPSKKPIIFIDEVHVVKGWHLFVRRLVDNGYKIFLTGSNSKLLSKEYATHIGGRVIEINMFPFSFREFLSVKSVDYNKKIIYSNKRFKLIKYLEEYIKFGGFPEVVLSDSNDIKVKLLESYLNTVVYRDIISRYGIEDENLFRLFVKKIADNITSPFSMYNLEKKMLQMGRKTTRKTLFNYLDYCEEAFFVLVSSLFKHSLKSRENERKVYFVDNGYLNLFIVGEEYGKNVENIIAMEIMRVNNELKYFRGKNEIDFITKIPIQVCYDISDLKTFEREVNTLIDYLTLKNLKKGLLITWDSHKKIKKNGKEIQLLPFYYFLLYSKEYI